VQGARQRFWLGFAGVLDGKAAILEQVSIPLGLLFREGTDPLNSCPYASGSETLKIRKKTKDRKVGELEY